MKRTCSQSVTSTYNPASSSDITLGDSNVLDLAKREISGLLLTIQLISENESHVTIDVMTVKIEIIS